MFLVATGLILLGGVFALLGQKLFRLLLPLVGFVVGVMVGFGGVQGIFGRGVISLTVAIVMALIVGVIMAVLSFLFYEIAVVILMAMLGASALTYLGVAIGLENNGLVLALLGIAGGIIGLIFGLSSNISIALIFAATAFLGVALVLAGVFLLVGEYSLDQLDQNGIIPSVIETVDQSFLWFFVWVAGSIVAMNAQINIAKRELVDSGFEFVELKK
jgi:hypothetical protein